MLVADTSKGIAMDFQAIGCILAAGVHRSWLINWSGLIMLFNPVRFYGVHVPGLREVASLLRVCTATVYSLCERGQLAHIRVGASIRIHQADVNLLLRSHP